MGLKKKKRRKQVEIDRLKVSCGISERKYLDKSEFTGDIGSDRRHEWENDGKEIAFAENYLLEQNIITDAHMTGFFE